MKKEEFLKLGLEYDKYSWKELNEIAEVGDGTVKYWLKKKGINKKPSGNGSEKRKLVPSGKIENLINEGFSTSQIARKLELTTRQITTYRCKNKIGSSNNSHLSKFDKIELTEVEKQVILGSLLGDGCIDLVNRARDYCRLGINHGAKQIQYIVYKYELLKRIAYKPKIRIKIDKRPKFREETEMISLRTIQSPLFKFYRDRWYKPSKVLCKEDFNTIDQLGLAIWYMDDGYNTSSGCHICTDCFSYEDVSYMKEKLLEKFDLVCTIQKHNRLYITAQSKQKFFDLIKKYIPRDMMYKVSTLKKLEELLENPEMDNQQPSS